MNQKGSVTLPVIIIVLVVVVIGGYFVFNSNKRIPDKTPNISEESTETTSPPVTESNQPNTDITADWQTYHNEEYGFEFKYPPSFPAPQLRTIDEHVKSLFVGGFSVAIGSYYNSALQRNMTLDEILKSYSASAVKENIFIGDKSFVKVV